MESGHSKLLQEGARGRQESARRTVFDSVAAGVEMYDFHRFICSGFFQCIPKVEQQCTVLVQVSP